MKQFLMVLIALFSTVSISMAGIFAPTKMNISAPSTVHYSFDNSLLRIPVTVSGSGGTGIFMIYTNGQSSKVSKVNNGFLGWHYVNKIDTSIYLAPLIDINAGSSELQWNGKDDDGNTVVAGTYTYYYFGFDSKKTKVKACNTINPYYGSVIVEKGADGKVLSNPFISTPKMRWVLGSDPEDPGFIETTAYTAPTGFSLFGYSLSGYGGGPVSLDPSNYNIVYSVIWNKDTGIGGLAKYSWVPNGEATLHSEWADGGYSMTTYKGNRGPGVVTDGSYLYTGESDHVLSTEAVSAFRVYDFDGSMLSEIDLTGRWSSIDDQKRGGQINGGPWVYRERNGRILLNCHCSCVKEMVNPLAVFDNQEDFLVWSNRNGDYILDHNYDTSSERPWVCNDFNVAPETYCVDADAHMFSAFMTNYIGAVSFALLGPDGTGIGYFAYAGETSGRFDGIESGGTLFCQNGSAFDGIYTDNLLTSEAQTSTGTWYIAHDSVQGIITDIVSVGENPLKEISVSQNSPNPFNPATTISFSLAKAGKTTIDVYNVAGQKVDTVINTNMSAGSHSVTWNAVKFSAGVYFYTVKSGGFTKTMRMTLLK